MFTLLIIIIIIGALLMIGVVLLQPGKGDLTATFGGLSSQFGSVFGMQRASNLLEKVTKWLAVIILLLIIIVNKFFVVPQYEEQQVKPSTEGVQVPTNNSPNVLAPAPVQPKPEEQPKENK